MSGSNGDAPKEAVSLPSNEECESEEVVSLQDVLDQQEYLTEAAQCLLGNADDEQCSYDQGYMKRQPLYSCITCASNLSTGPAGICLACGLHCHDGHDCVELYTKRNFRCDCGNGKFGQTKCTLKSNKDASNELNTYNQNYQGLYCTCHRPYPDSENPENDDDDHMIQCIICEDWFHATHAKILDEELDFDEFACNYCVTKLPFLRNYSLRKESTSVNGGASESKSDGSPGIRKCSKPEFPADPEITDEIPACFAEGWRKNLCTCTDCQAIYKQNKCEFLLDDEDTLQFYEEKAKLARDEPSGSGGGSDGSVDSCLRALNKFDRVQQIEMISEYKKMSVGLKQFLEKFATDGKVVTESDIYGFFDDLRSRKRMRLDNGEQRQF